MIPYPKYDTDQKEYYSYSHDQYTAFAIASTCQNVPAAAAVLEAMGSYSYRDTEPAYLNIALKGKYMSDSQSRKMIDLAVKGLRVDTAWIYLYTTIIREFPSSFRGPIKDGNEAFASTYTALERQINRVNHAAKGDYEKLFSEID